MDEQQQKWQQLEAEMKQLAEEQQKEQPDLFLLRSIGGLVGAICGPITLFALVILAETLRIDKSSGSPIMLFLFLLVAVPVGALIGALSSPSVMKLMDSFARRTGK